MKNLQEYFKPRDMTTGVPWKRIAGFSIPLLVGNIFQQLYSTVDSIIVGRYIGDHALAAVGSSMPLLFLLMVFVVGISTGSSIMVSQYFGAKMRKELSHAIGVTITLTLLAGIFLTTLGPIFAGKILRMLNTPEVYFEWSRQYLVIYLLGSIGFAYYNIFAGILRGLGDSVSALLFLMISTFTNIALDLLFVAVFHWGVPGVAIATIISQAFSAILCYFKLRSLKDYDMGWRYMKLDRLYAGQLVRLGLPSGITQAVFALAMVLVQNLTNSFGPFYAAAGIIVMRVDGFAVLPNFSFGIAMTTYTGQNVGAGKMKRVISGMRQGLTLSLITVFMMTALIVIFGKSIIALFTSTPELQAYSYRMLLFLVIGYFFFAITQVLGGVLRGAGDTVTPMWISMIIVLFVRVPIAYGIAWLTRSPEFPIGRPESIFISLLLTWITGSLLTMVAYRMGRWKSRALVQGHEDVE